MQESASAKLNLFLHILGKRPDGYHELQSLVVFVPGAADKVLAEPAEALSLRVTGPYAAALAGEEVRSNLVYRAAEQLRQAAGTTAGAALTLEKHLPVAAGIGGGSSDAAAAIRLLMRVWNVSPERDVLQAVAQKLGSDVPACLFSRPVLMEGVGERLTPIALPFPLPIVLVNPGIPLSSAAVYREVRPPYRQALAAIPPWPDIHALTHWLKDTHNDLEAPALRLVPAISHVLAELEAHERCLLARMSGSGTTCFGLFADQAGAEQAAQAIRSLRPEWWVS